MGHIRLGTLPKTQKWNQVVSLITGGAVVERIAASSADAAEHGLELASQDEGLAHAFWLLTQIPQAARQSNFQNDCGNWASMYRAAGRPFWKLLPRLQVPLIATFTSTASAATSARWRSMPPPKHWHLSLAASCRASLGRRRKMSNRRWPSSARRIGSASSRAISFLG